MPPINGIQGIGPSQFLQQAKKAAQSNEAGQFVDTLGKALEKAQASQADSAKAIENYVSGKSDSVLPVVQSVANADMSFKLLIGVRNKVIDAYKQTMNMNI
ncbi:MAG: flagellar hook-basal body complex protein FliE [Phycisphaerae bacterium]